MNYLHKYGVKGDDTAAWYASPLSGSPNTAYTAHFARPNFGYAETSYMPRTLCEIVERI